MGRQTPKERLAFASNAKSLLWQTMTLLLNRDPCVHASAFLCFLPRLTTGEDREVECTPCRTAVAVLPRLVGTVLFVVLFSAPLNTPLGPKARDNPRSTGEQAVGIAEPSQHLNRLIHLQHSSLSSGTAPARKPKRRDRLGKYRTRRTVLQE
jgi:hypothetical protein